MTAAFWWLLLAASSYGVATMWHSLKLDHDNHSETTIMMLLAASSAPMHGLDIVKASGKALTRGCIYVHLSRLEDLGIVASMYDPDDREQPRRRIYWLTADKPGDKDMSRMEVYFVNSSGDVRPLAELGNSWLGAAFVWTHVGERYFGKWDFETEYDKYKASGAKGRFDQSGWERAWTLHSDPKVAEWDWATLVSTFDKMLIPREHFEYMAKQFELFYEAHRHAGRSHYKELARILREGMPEGARGLCFNATSVGENPWWVHGENEEDENEEDEGRPYNIDRDHDHQVFDPAERPKPTDP